MNRKKQTVIWGSFLILFTGCAALSTMLDFKRLYGSSQPRERVVQTLDAEHVDYWQDVKPVLDRRCVVCHGCYDAACQLKLTAIEGLERGAHKVSVYNSTRITQANMTRLFEDGHSITDWRDLRFFPVLNEYAQTPEANKQAGVMHRILKLKAENPLPEKDILEAFTFGVGRNDICPKAEEMDTYAQQNPLWGMPYGLPGLSEYEQNNLEKWLEQGATYTQRPPVKKIFNAAIQRWEALLNQDDLKSQLISRYIYEHLFLGHLYFNDISKTTFFKLVRSKTPQGEPIEPIATRRPYDDPGVSRVYYRFLPQIETIVSKNHMHYALSPQRMKTWKNLFYEREFDVSVLPAYGTKEGANPFITYTQLPMKSRYKFMLDEAQFTIMNYIKGPVCRGGVALNVINDRFWVFFVDPDLPIESELSAHLDANAENLELPSALGDIYMPLISWKRYATKARENRKMRDSFLLKHLSDEKIRYDLSLIWNGNGENKNAALTIFRHYDNASVKKGLIGDNPKTAWVISYPLLERIHYLLVAGYDVYGNIGHNLLSRLHMDFLRMEGEAAFLMLLPQFSRQKERDYWYRSANEETIKFLMNPETERLIQPDIAYKTDNHKNELFDMLKTHLGNALDIRHDIGTIENLSTQEALKRLSKISGTGTDFMSEMSVIEIIDGTQTDRESIFVTLLKNTGHLNITAMLSEYKNIKKDENTLTVAKGVLGSYPNVYFKVEKKQLAAFVDHVESLQSAEDYKSLMDTFGVRRTNNNFWQHSDHVHTFLRNSNKAEFGWLDYNRLENR